MNNQTRTDRTRKFFQLDSWDMDAADAWQHVFNGACDDEDLHGNLNLSALDLSDMFNEYRAFGSACNDAFHYLIDNVDAIVRIAGFVYIDCEGTGAGSMLDDYENFIVEAEDEENLAAAIAADRLDDGTDAKELDGSVWRVRKLGEEFDYNVNLEYICKGERL